MDTRSSSPGVSLLSCALVVMLAGGVFGSCLTARDAFAVTAAEKQAEADAVYAQIDSLQTSLNETRDRYENASSSYEEAIALRDEASRQIQEETERIEALQEDLSTFAVGMYKQGGPGSFIDVLLQTNSFEEFLTSWDVCNSISNKGASLIDNEKAAREQLKQAKATYEEQSARAESEMNNAEAALQQIEDTQEALRAEAAKLSDEADELQMQEELAAEAARQAEEARKAQEAALAAAYNSGASSEAAASASAAAGASVLMGSGYFTNPCPTASSSSGFGYRSFDNSFHKGLDMAAPEGTPYYAADSGTVMYATNGGGYNGGAGNWVVISHGNGIVTKYMHSQVTFVNPGDQVERGQNIGLVGNTGQSFGAHLHFQVEVNGVAVNPLNYI
ncbi:MAG: peptidoglycan DD-metalloendopeptidase family protein [Eggerthellaceae bacterium]|nr:peptidoglycan DD-metalloendopeptidase family protein [Eggerthellaceae bacterium]